MGNHWKRWRAYMDELEEALRMAGEDLSAVESTSAHEHQRLFWRRPQREAVGPRLVALARDIPFLRNLVEEAARLGADPQLPAPPDEIEAWREGEERHELLSRRLDRPALDPRGASGPPRSSGHPAAEASAAEMDPTEASTAGVDPTEASTAGVDPAEGASAPARLRNAERALAHRTRSLVVVLEELSSPRNASAIVRTAEALGLQEIHFIDRRGKVKLNPAITRMCQRWMDLVWHRRAEEALAELKERGYQVVAADFGAGSRPIHELPLQGKLAVVLGSEQEGVSRVVREQADGLFHLPTVGFTSYLNVSVTAGIALHEFDHRLRAAGQRSPLDEEDRCALRKAWYAILAGDDPARRRSYAAWLEQPPPPAPPLKAVPSREKLREREQEQQEEGRRRKRGEDPGRERDA